MKLLRTLIASVTALFICSAASAQTADFDYPSEVWPYLFPEFQSGTVMLTSGSTHNDINVCVDGTLHYLNEKGTILEADMKTVLSCKVGNRIYINLGKGLMEILAGDTDPLVVKLIEYDPNKASGPNIGYGITDSNFASQSMDLTTISSSYRTKMVNSLVSDIKQGRMYGTKIPTKETLSMRIGDEIIPATKNAFLERVGKDKGNAFLKNSKVKWNSPETILPAAEFIFNNK